MLRLNYQLSWFWLAVVVAAPASGQSRSAAEVRKCQADNLGKVAASLDGRRCFESAAGWFLTTDSLWASRASAAAEEGATRFQQIFDEPIGRGVVLQTALDTNGRRTSNDSLERRFPAAWTWNSPVRLDAAQSAAQQLRAFSGLERHEMGHQWFTLWAKRHDTKDTIPYWMMETPAILMEDSATTDTRYQNLKLLPSQGATRIPLAVLFTMQNPVVRVVGNAAFDPRDVLQGELFYDECRAFADYLIARTGNPRIFGMIALSVIHGETIGQWLQANGARYRLPTTVEALGQEWQRWLP